MPRSASRPGLYGQRPMAPHGLVHSSGLTQDNVQRCAITLPCVSLCGCLSHVAFSASRQSCGYSVGNCSLSVA
eukprot:8678481-Alexandrium_andersonii.AAC.1